MFSEHVTVYRAGSFATEPEPAWRRAARDEEPEPGYGWIEQLSCELDAEPTNIFVLREAIYDTNVLVWTLREGGRYVEFRTDQTLIDGVLVPRQEDWLPFHIGFVVPFLQGHATLALSHRQDRIANVLIATARHGKGKHICSFSGQSTIDLVG